MLFYICLLGCDKESYHCFHCRTPYDAFYNKKNIIILHNIWCSSLEWSFSSVMLAFHGINPIFLSGDILSIVCISSFHHLIQSLFVVVSFLSLGSKIFYSTKIKTFIAVINQTQILKCFFMSKDKFQSNVTEEFFSSDKLLWIEIFFDQLDIIVET